MQHYLQITPHEYGSKYVAETNKPYFILTYSIFRD